MKETFTGKKDSVINIPLLHPPQKLFGCWKLSLGSRGPAPTSPSRCPRVLGASKKPLQGKVLQELACLHLFNIPPLPHPPPPWLLQWDSSAGQGWLSHVDHPKNGMMSPPARDEPLDTTFHTETRAEPRQLRELLPCLSCHARSRIQPGSADFPSNPQQSHPRPLHSLTLEH